jgi:peptide/nickel transport system permease protein
MALQTRPAAGKKRNALEDSYYLASQWELMWRKFRRHKMAMIGGLLLILFYLAGAFCGFLSPYDPNRRFSAYQEIPPMRVRFFEIGGGFRLRPFVYGIKKSQDPVTWESIYVEDESVRYPIRFFVRGDRYKLWGLFRTDLHLFGVEAPGVLFLLGTDTLARDLFSRNLYASRLSLSIGLVGVAVSFVLGCILGGIAGYYGGTADMLIQRVIEFLLSIPKIPLWLALAAALPDDWPMIRIYFGITIVLSLVGWTGLARVVRGKLLQLREEDFTLAARIAGGTDWYIITQHLLPSFMSYLIVNITLRIPQMILGETALSFLGVGLREPAVSWGVLLQDAQNVRTIALHPWLLLPAVFVIVVVLAFNFLGDGLRDAADPYK